MIKDRIVSEAQAWHSKYKKPVLISEYGADTMPGLHEVSKLYKYFYDFLKNKY